MAGGGKPLRHLFSPKTSLLAAGCREATRWDPGFPCFTIKNERCFMDPLWRCTPLSQTQGLEKILQRKIGVSFPPPNAAGDWLGPRCMLCDSWVFQGWGRMVLRAWNAKCRESVVRNLVPRMGITKTKRLRCIKGEKECGVCWAEELECHPVVEMKCRLGHQQATRGRGHESRGKIISMPETKLCATR